MGKTVLVSSHILTELADFCTSIGIIEAGRVLASGRIEDITAKLAGNLMVEIGIKGDPEPALAALAERVDVTRVTCDGKMIHAEFTGNPDDLDDLLQYLVNRGLRINRFAQTRAGLEDIFLKVTKGIVA